MPSDDIARLYDFTANTRIESDQVDAELDQLVTACNGKAGRSVNNSFTGNNTFAGDDTFTGLPSFSNTSGLKTDTITERSSGVGVTIDSVLVKDGTIKVPGSAGYTPTANGEFGYDSTSHTYDVYVNGAAKSLLHTGSGIDDLSDVAITSVSSGDILTYNGTNWVNSGGYLYVQDEKTSGTDGGSSSANTWMTRDLNTTVTNTISGASLSSNQITLPAGTYEVIRAWAPARAANNLAGRIRLRNVTDSTTTIKGANTFAGSTSGTSYGIEAHLSGVFTIAAQKTFELQHRVTGAATTNGLGVAISEASVNEVYAGIVIRRVA